MSVTIQVSITLLEHAANIKMINLIVLFCVSVTTVCGALQRVDPLVLINQGLVRGQKATDGDYSTFLGIPFAKVDLDNPFGPAKPAPTFEEDIFIANKGSTQCPQTPFSGYPRADTISRSESVDCLELDIYVPSKASIMNPLPVLVWIHGGYFIRGTGHDFAARNLVKHDVIVVSINYRLGAYGFICLDDPAAPGNQGLKDQYAALQWVRDNIAAFGGNPYNVTIAGQSAGSTSAVLHLFSPKLKLFHKVIAQSGTPFSPDMFTMGDHEAATRLASYLGLNTTDNKLALEFLAKTSHTLITGATHDLKIEFKPCKETYVSDDIFIDTDPVSLSNARKIRNTPILIGNTDFEYLEKLELRHGNDFFAKDFFYSRLQRTFEIEEAQLESVANIVRHYYIGDKPISEEVKHEAEIFSGDIVFNYPIQDTITKLIEENANPVYEYVFSYVGDSGMAGAAHNDELKYLFDISGGTVASLANPTDDDQLLVDRLTTLWANFIKYGNPTPGTSDLIPVKWTPVTETTRPYYSINKDLKMVTDERFLKERMAFWDIFHSMYEYRK